MSSPRWTCVSGARSPTSASRRSSSATVGIPLSSYQPPELSPTGRGRRALVCDELGFGPGLCSGLAVVHGDPLKVLYLGAGEELVSAGPLGDRQLVHDVEDDVSGCRQLLGEGRSVALEGQLEVLDAFEYPVAQFVGCATNIENVRHCPPEIARLDLPPEFEQAAPEGF